MAPTEEASIKRTIRRHQLREMVPLADSTIYEMEQRGGFPRRFALSPDVWYGIHWLRKAARRIGRCRPQRHEALDGWSRSLDELRATHKTLGYLFDRV